MSSSPPPTSAQEIDAVLETHARAVGAFGMSAGISRAGSAATFGAWGLDGRNPESPMPASGRFRIGSVTKTFTAAMVLELVDRNELTLDDTIARWVPAYPHASEMSVRSLLTHTSGTADMTTDAFSDFIGLLLSDLTRRFTPGEVVALMSALPPHAAPGEAYRYSNTDYWLLGYIAEAISGRSYAELLTELFAIRLGLTATTYDDTVPDDLLHGWFDIEPPDAAGASPRGELDARDFPNEALITTAFAAGGITSSLADLLRWTEALYSGDALSAAMRDRLLASPCVEDPVSGRWHGFGVVGYGTRLPDGTWPAYGHAGNIPGSSAFIAWFPGTRTAVAMHANVQEVTTEAFVALAFDLAV